MYQLYITVHNYVCTVHINDVLFFTSLAGAMAEAFVKETIEKNSVVLFSKTYCPFCTMAKDVLKAAGLQKVTDLTIIHSKFSQANCVSLCLIVCHKFSTKCLIMQYCLLSWCSHSDIMPTTT